MKHIINAVLMQTQDPVPTALQNVSIQNCYLTIQSCSGGLYDNSGTLLEPCVMLLESFCLALEIERFHMDISNMRQNHQSIYSEKTTQHGFSHDGDFPGQYGTY